LNLERMLNTVRLRLSHTGFCCGHATAAPPSSVMKSRRLMQNCPIEDKAYQRAALCVTAKLIVE